MSTPVSAADRITTIAVGMRAEQIERLRATGNMSLHVRRAVDAYFRSLDARRAEHPPRPASAPIGGTP